MSDASSLPTRPIFLSASVPTRPPFERKPDAAFQVEQAVISLVRAVFAKGGRLVFGGHPSISPLVASVAAEYFPVRPTEVKSSDGGPRELFVGREDAPITIYQSRAFDGFLPKDTRDMVKYGFAQIRWTEAVNNEKFDKDAVGKFQCWDSLQDMRRKLIVESEPIALATIGGMEGIFGEVELFLEKRPKKSIYTFKETGGAAECLANHRIPEFPERAKVVKKLDQYSGRSAWPSLIEATDDKWRHETGVAPDKRDPRDPRDCSTSPYMVMMQWLVERIAGGR